MYLLSEIFYIKIWNRRKLTSYLLWFPIFYTICLHHFRKRSLKSPTIWSSYSLNLQDLDIFPFSLIFFLDTIFLSWHIFLLLVEIAEIMRFCVEVMAILVAAATSHFVEIQGKLIFVISFLRFPIFGVLREPPPKTKHVLDENWQRNQFLKLNIWW